MFVSLSKLKIGFQLFLLLALIVFLKNMDFRFSLRIDDYIYTSWLFNYNYGFMRRALPGELISLLNLSYDYKSIRFISVFLLIFLFYLFSYLVLISIDKLKLNNRFLYLSSFLFLSFLTTQWILELGRFDQIVQIMILICILFLIKTNRQFLCYISIIITIVLSSLIHEASLIIFIPTIILINYMRFKNKKTTVSLCIFLLLSLILVVFFGKIDVNHANLIIENYKDISKFNYYAVRTTQLSNAENIITSISSMLNNKTYVTILLSVVYLYPCICFFNVVFNSNYFKIIILFALTPIGLSIIAFDYFRWIALSFFNLSVLCIYVINNNNENENEKLHKYIVKNKNNIISYGLLSLLVGALGVVNLFPNVYTSGGLASDRLPSSITEKLNMKLDTNDQIFEVNRNIKGWELELDRSQYKNFDLALDWYKNESLKGNNSAKNNLALMYINGGEITSNYAKSFSLFKDASSSSYEALNNLGVLYSNGISVDQDYHLALMYYTNAANKGSVSAMYNIGLSYMKGLNGLEKDKVRAQHWFEKAKIYNFAPAIYQLKTMNKR